MEARVPARLTPGEGRRFGLTVGGAFLALALILWWRNRPAGAIAAAVAGALLAGAGLSVPAMLGPVYRGWMAFGLALSKVTTPIFMGLVFFIVITPAGLIARLLGHRPLLHGSRGDAAGNGVWVDRDAEHRKSDLQRQF